MKGNRAKGKGRGACMHCPARSQDSLGFSVLQCDTSVRWHYRLGVARQRESVCVAQDRE